MGYPRSTTALVLALCACLLARCGHSEGRTHDSSTSDDVEDATDPAEEEISGPRECTDEEMLALEVEVMRLAPEGDPCFSGSVNVSNEEVDAHVDLMWWSLCLYCGPDGYGERLDEREARVEEAVSVLIPECTIPYGSRTVCVGGGSLFDYGRIVEAAEEACDHLWPPTHDYGRPIEGAEFFLDDDGVVTEVADDGWEDPMEPEELECILASLDGLTFPCLAGFHLCPTTCMP